MKRIISANCEKRTRECKESRTKFQATIGRVLAFATLPPDENCEDDPTAKAQDATCELTAFKRAG